MGTTCAVENVAYNWLVIDPLRMFMSDLNNLDTATFDAWLLEQSGAGNMSDDQLLTEVFSKMMMEETPEGRAQGLVDVANMCLAMADKSLGSQVPVATCLTLIRH